MSLVRRFLALTPAAQQHGFADLDAGSLHAALVRGEVPGRTLRGVVARAIAAPDAAAVRLAVGEIPGHQLLRLVLLADARRPAGHELLSAVETAQAVAAVWGRHPEAVSTDQARVAAGHDSRTALAIARSGAAEHLAGLFRGWTTYKPEVLRAIVDILEARGRDRESFLALANSEDRAFIQDVLIRARKHPALQRALATNRVGLTRHDFEGLLATTGDPEVVMRAWEGIQAIEADGRLAPPQPVQDDGSRAWIIEAVGRMTTALPAHLATAQANVEQAVTDPVRRAAQSVVSELQRIEVEFDVRLGQMIRGADLTRGESAGQRTVGALLPLGRVPESAGWRRPQAGLQDLLRNPTATEAHIRPFVASGLAQLADFRCIIAARSAAVTPALLRAVARQLLQRLSEFPADLAYAAPEVHEAREAVAGALHDLASRPEALAIPIGATRATAKPLATYVVESVPLAPGIDQSAELTVLRNPALPIEMRLAAFRRILDTPDRPDLSAAVGAAVEGVLPVQALHLVLHHPRAGEALTPTHLHRFIERWQLARKETTPQHREVELRWYHDRSADAAAEFADMAPRFLAHLEAEAMRRQQRYGAHLGSNWADTRVREMQRLAEEMDGLADRDAATLQDRLETPDAIGAYLRMLASRARRAAMALRTAAPERRALIVADAKGLTAQIDRLVTKSSRPQIRQVALALQAGPEVAELSAALADALADAPTATRGAGATPAAPIQADRPSGRRATR